MKTAASRIGIGAAALALGVGAAVMLTSSSGSQAISDREIFCSEFVPNVEAADTYKRFTKTAPLDTQRWINYRTAICSGLDPVPPTMATPFGKALAAAGEMAVSVAEEPPPTTTTTTTTTTTEPPPPTQAASPLAYLRLGNGDLPSSHQGDFRYIISSGGWSGQSFSSVPSQTTVVSYMSSVSCLLGASWHYGVTGEDARANGWVLKDSNGIELINTGYPSNLICDPGSSGYQQKWISNVTNLLNQWNADGVFIDDVQLNPTMIAGKYPAKYPTQQAWLDAMTSFAQAIYSALNAQGFKVTWNAAGYVYGDANSDSGTNDLNLQAQLFPYGEAVMLEYCQWRDNFPQGPDVRGMGPEWWNQWDSWQRIPAQSKAAGEGTLCNQYSTDTADRNYVLASFLLDWDGQHGAFVADNWYADFQKALDLGAPVANKVLNGQEWSRQFEHGTVVVNPYLKTSSINAT